MIAFLFILLIGLALIYINVSSVAKDKTGKIIGAAVLFVLFLGMFLRSTLIGSLIVTFFAVWLPNSLILYIPWTLYRIGYYFTQPHHLSRHLVRRVSRYLLGITCAFTFIFIGYGMQHNDEYKTNLLTIDLPGVYTESFTAIFFSDIHVDPLFKAQKLERLIAQVDSIKPDYLLFGGDLADITTEKMDHAGYDSLFKKLTAGAKVAAVAINGNHEAFMANSDNSPEEWMRKVGFVVLDDSTACLGGVCFTGRTDFTVARSRDTERKPLSELIPDSIKIVEHPKDSTDSLADTTKVADSQASAATVQDSTADSAVVATVTYDTIPLYRPWILLDHQPKGIEKTHAGRLPDFALSGHTHDGQFFPITFIIDYVWKLAYGKGALSGVLWLVSSGFDCWGPPVRLGSDSEIWVIKFKAKNQENQ
ncbi:metallophosphoesterase [Fibrobacter succinogenes]|uniref:metallophosphoesterase n=1 Tax=Fibrobacter succinogenes TaxID=833 RepID=UPI0013D0AAC7|nr:metallophosphoesterase [Fibrobacter succinogenes]